MAQSHHYEAPWSPLLAWITGLSCLVLGGLMLGGLTNGPRHAGPGIDAIWFGGTVVMPACILFGSAWFTITGYVVMPGEILVRRLGWTSRIRLAGLESVRADPEAMQGSLKTFGNGGLFSFSGWFWNRRLGHYRAWATDPLRAVVLRVAGRTLVVTPHDPSAFVAELRAAQASEPA